MKSRFMRCEFCNVEITDKVCELSTYRKVIDGQEYLFCCRKCAERHEQRRK
jgi:YHS domain-containing protein